MFVKRTRALTTCRSCNRALPPYALAPIRDQCLSKSSIERPQTRQVSSQRSSSGGSANNNDHEVPAWPKKPNPSPYDIFDIKKSAPYTKKRFYQLVKLYHPDTHSHETKTSTSTSTTTQPSSPPELPSSNAAALGRPPLTHATRLERYRLVVAANDILSDKAKRRLYDDYGIGWAAGGPDAAATPRERDQAWRYQSGSPASNATWEDWQRWHEARQGNAKAEPLYMSNGAFAFAVIALCSIGAMAHVHRAETTGAEYVDYSAQQNANIGNTVRRRTMASAGRSKDERVDTFLRDRENLSYQFVPSKYDTAKEESSENDKHS